VTGRVLVTARGRGNGHKLAELAAGDGGQLDVRLYGRRKPGDPLAAADGELTRLGQGILGGGQGWRVECAACGRPYLVTRAALDAAAAAGEPVIIVAPLV